MQGVSNGFSVFYPELLSEEAVKDLTVALDQL